jgi:hypothetical protein
VLAVVSSRVATPIFDHVLPLVEAFDAADTVALAAVCVELGHVDAATVARATERPGWRP